MNTKPRHYLHGDEKEGEKGIYYCAACDLFVSTDHFYKECRETNDYERFQRTLKHWNKLKKQGTKHQRPSNAQNLFELTPNWTPTLKKTHASDKHQSSRDCQN